MINVQETTPQKHKGKSTWPRTKKKNEQERVLTLLLSDFAHIFIHLLQNVPTGQVVCSSANLLVNKGHATSQFHETYHVLSVLNVGKAPI